MESLGSPKGTTAHADRAGGVSPAAGHSPHDAISPSYQAGAGIPPLSPRRHSKEFQSHPTLGKGGLSLGSPKLARDRSKSLGQYPSNYAPSLSASSAFFPQSPYGASPSASPIINSGGTFIPSAGMPPMVPSLEPGSQTRTAVEHAVQTERERTKEKEKEEANLTADELRVVLKRERNRMSRMAADLAMLKSASVQSQLEAEVVEEGRINCLMRRVESLQQEKGRIILELEREEEMLTNTLQKKLDEVKREKGLLEAQLEREHAEHADLQTLLSSVKKAKQETIEKSQTESGP